MGIIKIWRKYGLKPALKSAAGILRSGNISKLNKEKYMSTMPSEKEIQEAAFKVKESGIDLGGGDYHIFKADTVKLHPLYFSKITDVIKEKRPCFIYTDEYKYDKKRLLYKPDFAPDTLWDYNYMGRCVAVKADYVDEIVLKYVKANQYHEINKYVCKKAAERNEINKIHHVREALFEDESDACGEKKSDIKIQNIEKVSYFTRFPKVSIIIPNCNHMQDLKRCVESITELTDYPSYEIIIVENNSDEQAVFDYYKKICTEKREKIEASIEGDEHKKNKMSGKNEGVEAVCDYSIKVIEYKSEFNYSAINNFAVKHATGELILLLNNDTKVINQSWLKSMVKYAVRENTGAVGACLLYENNTIQHAGVIVGIGPNKTAVHPNSGEPFENEGYRSSIHHVQNYSAVTGACLLVKKTEYEAVGGLSQELAVAYNDIDFCLKLRKKGLLNVYVPDAMLYHYESKSRGLDISSEKAQRLKREADIFTKKWSMVLNEGDPYYNPNLSRSIPWEL